MISDDQIELLPPSMGLVEEFHEVLIDSYEEHSQFLKWAEIDPALDKTSSNMAEAMTKFEEMKGELRFIITRRSDQRILGCIGLLIRDMDIPYLEIGYWARTSESGKGYISRAVRLIEQFAVRELSVRRLEIKIATTNHASRRVAERSGFIHEATHQSDRTLPSGEVTGTHVFCKTYS